MKAQIMLLAGTMAGLSFVATPVLSQERPETPGMQRPPGTTPGQDRLIGNDFKSAMRMLEGSWQVSVKTFGAGGAEAGNTVQGTSNRRWILNQNILQEEVRTSQAPAGARGSDTNFQIREPGSPAQNRPGSMSQSFEGHGMFGFDPTTNEFQHVWADSLNSKIGFSTGRYDERTRTFTFMKESGGMTTTPPRTSPPITTPPPTTPPRRPDTAPPTVPPGRTPGDDDLNMQVDPNPSAPPTTPPARPATPSTQRPGMTDVDLSHISRVVIRIQDENRHVVEYYGAGQTKLMEITYTKGAAGATSR